ncbi:MAG: sensor histidine kinase, partial [Raoultibacter sp.]
MGLGSYLKDRLVLIVLGVVCIASVALVLFALALGFDATCLVCFIIGACAVAGLAFDYLHRRRFYAELESLV